GAGSEYSPYFFYHHRGALRPSAAANPNDEEITAPCSYLDENPCPMSSQCGQLSDLGRVSAETLAWLLCPNQVVVIKDGSLLTAAVLQSPPKSPSCTVEISCWSWGYDGTSLQRRSTQLT